VIVRGSELGTATPLLAWRSGMTFGCSLSSRPPASALPALGRAWLSFCLFCAFLQLYRPCPHYTPKGAILKSPIQRGTVLADAVVAEMEDARGLELRNTTNVIRVQVPFTAVTHRIWLTRMAEYREKLPDLCPPSDAQEINTEFDVFRLVNGKPPTDGDFKSQRALRPEARFRDIDECIARGLSVDKKINDANNTKKLPKFRDFVVCRVRLHAGAGRIKQTGKRQSHHTWWPYHSYDILCRCEVLE
jgi:hypothetical protein